MKVEVLEPVTVTCLKGSIIEIAPAQVALLGNKVQVQKTAPEKKSKKKVED